MNSLVEDLELTSQVDAYYDDVWCVVRARTRGLSKVCGAIGLQDRGRSMIFNIRAKKYFELRDLLRVVGSNE